MVFIAPDLDRPVFESALDAINGLELCACFQGMCNNEPGRPGRWQSHFGIVDEINQE